MEEIQAASAKKSQPGKPNALEQMQAAVANEEQKQPAAAQDANPPLRHTVTLNYQVAWLDGPAERLQTQIFQSNDQAFDFYTRVAKISDTRLILKGSEVYHKDAVENTKLEKLKKMALQL